MVNKKASVFCLVLGLVVLFGSSALAQDIYGESDSTESSAEENMSPLDSMESQPLNDESEEDGDRGGGGLGGPLLLTRHTMQLGGEIAITPHVYVPDQGDSQGGGTFSFSPFLGYFVIDNLEILFGFNLWLPFGDTVGGYDVTVGFDVGARYIFDFNVVCLYVGGLFGPSFVIPDNPDWDVATFFNISLPVGILLPFNEHVALNAGMRFNFDIHLGEAPANQPVESTIISFPMGYFGVEGFFNLFD